MTFHATEENLRFTSKIPQDFADFPIKNLTFAKSNGMPADNLIGNPERCPDSRAKIREKPENLSHKMKISSTLYNVAIAAAILAGTLFTGTPAVSAADVASESNNVSAHAATEGVALGVRFHNLAADTTRITNILIEECKQQNAGNIVRIAEQLIGTPYGAATLDGHAHEPEMLTVNLDSLDCTTFVETVLALAATADHYRRSWRDFTYYLGDLRYRGGHNKGYGSRLHYASEWIVDNSARGNLREVTADVDGARHNVKTLDFMSAHRELYPALADSLNFDAIRRAESGYSNHRYPVVKAGQAKDKRLMSVVRNGDVVLFTTSAKGLDVSHMGIVKIVDGRPRMIHASSSAGKVILDPLTIPEYIARHRAEGIRLVRLVK